MAEQTIIREFRKDDVRAIVEFSLRSWEPVFASLRQVLGDDIFLRLHADWKEDQADAVRSACTNEERDVFVAVTDGRPSGFVAVALNAFHEGMGAIDIIGVDPDYQGAASARGSPSSRLSTCAAVAWTSPSWKPAATRDTNLRGQLTRQRGSRSCRSPVTSGYSTERPQPFGSIAPCASCVGPLGWEAHVRSGRRPSRGARTYRPTRSTTRSGCCSSIRWPCRASLWTWRPAATRRSCSPRRGMSATRRAWSSGSTCRSTPLPEHRAGPHGHVRRHRRAGRRRQSRPRLAAPREESEARPYSPGDRLPFGADVFAGHKKNDTVLWVEASVR